MPYFKKGSCQKLTGSRLLNPCVGVVDYDFFLPYGVSSTSLITLVNSRLNTTILPNFRMECQTRIVRLVCSNVYLKCVDGVNLTDYSTYNYDISRETTATKLYGLPFLRPCGSACTEISQYCTGLGRLIPQLNCSEKYDYSQGFSKASWPKRYEISNNQSRCYAANLVTLSGPKEKYFVNYTNPVCSGLIDDFYIPPADRLNPKFSPLQLSGAVQTLLNQRVDEQLKKLPLWVDSECMLALRKQICYSVFLSPQDVTIFDAVSAGTPEPTLTSVKGILNNLGALMSTVTLPSYPHQNICHQYLIKCSKLIEAIPSLDTDCNSTIATKDSLTIRSFPTATQSIYYQTFRIRAGTATLNGAFNFKTRPYSNVYYNKSEYSYQPMCPRGFSLPDEKDAVEVQMVGASGCAVDCL